jgi:REP element-mobilizing transposase RayT
MGRPLRAAPGGLVYHVLNRANGRQCLFEEDGDYAAFERVLGEAQQRIPMRILAYCVMPNHWHLVLWPYRDGDLSRFMNWLTLTHTQRWHAHRQTVGTPERESWRAVRIKGMDGDNRATVGTRCESPTGRQAAKAGGNVECPRFLGYFCPHTTWSPALVVHAWAFRP